MKQVYIYSKTQFNFQLINSYNHLKYVNGMVFTQQQSFEDNDEIDFSKMNGRNDNILVHVSENLPLNQFQLKYNNRTADISQENTQYERL